MKNKPVIMVTGADGQLGKTLQEKAKTKQEYQWLFLNKAKLDITKAAEVEAIIKQARPQFCINTAAYTNVTQAEKEKEKVRWLNVLAVGHLAEICSKHKTSLIHISTDYVFDGEKADPYTEEDLPNPLNEYGKTKALGEEIVLAQGLNHYVVRTAWLYAKTHGHNFYRSILQKAKEGKSLKVISNQIGTPTCTNILADYLLRLIEKKPKGGVYHCAGKKVQSWYAFAKDILKEHQLDVSLVKTFSPKEEVKRPRFSALTTIKPF